MCYNGEARPLGIKRRRRKGEIANECYDQRETLSSA